MNHWENIWRNPVCIFPFPDKFLSLFKKQALFNWKYDFKKLIRFRNIFFLCSTVLSFIHSYSFYLLSSFDALFCFFEDLRLK